MPQMSLHLSTLFQSTNAAREVYAIQVAEIRLGVDRAARAKAFSDALACAQLWMCDPRGESTVVVIGCPNWEYCTIARILGIRGDYVQA